MRHINICSHTIIIWLHGNHFKLVIIKENVNRGCMHVCCGFSPTYFTRSIDTHIHVCTLHPFSTLRVYTDFRKKVKWIRRKLDEKGLRGFKATVSYVLCHVWHCFTDKLGRYTYVHCTLYVASSHSCCLLLFHHLHTNGPLYLTVLIGITTINWLASKQLKAVMYSMTNLSPPQHQ